ncbi:MAG: hypothetical protein JSU86_05295 [Phycisphaerales bacterium]|nr:MAG: hypothetical protein JSU86_05295 [Phycisphaerales bacterium]
MIESSFRIVVQTAYLADVSHLSNFEPTSYADDPLDSNENDLRRRGWVRDGLAGLL